jgi:hypothetical protein
METPNNPAVAAIEFALELYNTCDAMTFLEYWNEGSFPEIRENWPEAPDAVFDGADPQFTQSKGIKL